MSRFRLPGLCRVLWVLAAAGLVLVPLTLPADQTVQVGPGMSFSPSMVTVAPGETVTWNFNETHTSTSDSQIGPETWDSGFLSSGTFAHTFQTPGTYPYYCALHSFAGGTLMNGVVEVSGAGATPTPTATLAPPATPTPTPPTPAASATPVSGAGAAGVPDLGGGMRVLFGVALAAAGIAALLLSSRR
jgi:plastocyanin